MKHNKESDMPVNALNLEIENRRLREKNELILDVMETMIPLTVCDKYLQEQWRKLIKEHRTGG